MSKRDSHFEELVALRDVLIEVLPRTGVDDLTTVAVESAKAVRAAFEELAKTSTKDEAPELLNHLTAMIASVPLSRNQPAETPLQPDELLECRQPSEAPSASTPAQTVPLFSDHRCQGGDLPQAPCPPIPA